MPVRRRGVGGSPHEWQCVCRGAWFWARAAPRLLLPALQLFKELCAPHVERAAEGTLLERPGERCPVLGAGRAGFKGLTGVRDSTFVHQEHQPPGKGPGWPVTGERASSESPSQAPFSASTIALGRVLPQSSREVGPAHGNQASRQRPGLLSTGGSAPGRLLEVGNHPAVALSGPRSTRLCPPGRPQGQL